LKKPASALTLTKGKKMAITAQDTAKIVKEYQRAPNDTASPEVQVALLTSRITYLTEHFKSNKKRQSLTSWFVGIGKPTSSPVRLLKKQRCKPLSNID